MLKFLHFFKNLNRVGCTEDGQTADFFKSPKANIFQRTFKTFLETSLTPEPLKIGVQYFL